MPTGARARALGAALVVLVVVTGATLATTRPWERAATCAQTRDDPNWSVARRWDEALLDAIRRALPNPPVHARNLFHLSVAMWDAWAAYDATASGYVFKEKRHAGDGSAARSEASSYAAYRVPPPAPPARRSIPVHHRAWATRTPMRSISLRPSRCSVPAPGWTRRVPDRSTFRRARSARTGSDRTTVMAIR